MTDVDQLFRNTVVNFSDIETGDRHYPGDTELLALNSAFAEHFKLTRLGIHHQRLSPGHRVSWPHAEADEEEFVYVIEGAPDLWLDGHVRRLKPGDGVGFPSGAGMAHTLINNTDAEVRLLVVGEPSRNLSRLH